MDTRNWCIQDSVPSPATGVAQEYWDFLIDAFERGALFADVFRQRTERYKEHSAKVAPHVLKFACAVLIDGRELRRPVNYVLVRVLPPDGTIIDPKKRPFIVVDPRAGHGPGIGGFKAQSEVGVAFAAGHPCYFIGFLPDPMPGQTIEDIADAEALFIEHVTSRHPDSDGKPVVIGNCQAGWAVMLLAATRPEIFGPIILAGSPLSYWAGRHGEYPLRYMGGLLGGSWLAALASDLGAGKFDGAWLVANFENLNPSNTFWAKHYNLYSKIDTEPPRYLEFEQWWGGHVLLNAEEMQFITDQLFIGNKLSSGEISLSSGAKVDLRSIRTPILAFCSKADNITPPVQALGWISDLYDSADEIRMNGQTIVYAVHETVGHLGIFVSGSVAKKEHDEFASNIDLIDMLPPGLYEAVMTPTKDDAVAADFVRGEYLVRFEARTLQDIRNLDTNDDSDNRKFAAAARVSEINLGLYRTFLQPWIRSWSNEALAEAWRNLHPLRLQYELSSSSNPIIAQLSSAAEQIQRDRHPVPADNIFWQAQEAVSDTVEGLLDGFRDIRDATYEAVFDAVYGSALLQALVGLSASDGSPRRRPGKNANELAFIERRKTELSQRITNGGPREAVIRSLLYIRMPDGVVDERGFNLMRQIRDEAGGGLSLAEFKAVVREQFFMLMLDETRAVEAIPKMMAEDPALASMMIRRLHRVLDAVGLQSEEAKARFAKLELMYSATASHATHSNPKPVQLARGHSRSKVSRTTKHT